MLELGLRPNAFVMGKRFSYTRAGAYARYRLWSQQASKIK